MRKMYNFYTEENNTEPWTTECMTEEQAEEYTKRHNLKRYEEVK
jgi:hypothetical protein